MLESVKSPLGANFNKENILQPHDNSLDSATSNAFDQGFPFQESSSISNMLANFEDFNINDENRPPSNPHFRINDRPLHADNTELASLKAELEASRRKLAEYETSRSNDVRTETSSGLLKYNPSSKNVFSSSSNPPPPPPDFVHKDILPWSDYDSSLFEIPTPHPLPFDFHAPIPPLRLPPPTGPFHAPSNPDPNINTGIIFFGDANSSQTVSSKGRNSKFFSSNSSPNWRTSKSITCSTSFLCRFHEYSR